MKALAGSLTFLNTATFIALLTGIMAHGLSRPVAICSVLAALVIGYFAYRTTEDVPLRVRRPKPVPPPELPAPKSKRAQRRAARAGTTIPTVEPLRWKYRSLWLWVIASFFTIFAFRSFCWLIYWDGNDVKVQSPNNLGDLSLHLTYIRHFASGVPLWPDNPIEPFSKLRYPAGVDIFNAVLNCLGIDVIHGLVWVAVIASIVTFYALYRWGGIFGIAAFLFNGGLPGFRILQTFSFRDDHGFLSLKSVASSIFRFLPTASFQDYQGVNSIAWKSIALSMFVTQRGVLYAFPVGLLLLYQWRARFFPDYMEPALVATSEEDRPASPPARRGPLPLWIEVSLYATLPLYHAHTFMALSLVLVFLFILGDWDVRKRTLLVVALAVVPATFCVWITTDYFHASSFIKWQPGWVQGVPKGDMAMPFVEFWLVNFGAWVPLVLFFLGIIGINVWKQSKDSEFKISAPIAFLIAAIAIFLVGYLVKLAPWEWDNIKIIVWAYIIVLPFLWTELIVQWPFRMRALVYLALFFSGFVTLFGGLAAGKNGFGIANREELDAVGVVVHKLPADARYAGWPTWGHPVLLQGRKMVLGYPGHLWTQGFDFADTNNKLQAMMLGAPNWKEIARSFHTRYLYWGREEKTNYAASKRPWERESALVASGDWGAIYDIESPRNPQPPLPPSVPR